ncbi:hypothetical protein [Anaerococcus sp. AGMB09787]|uniref:hypothetical protein n=1 Tax=Anaerococcus sp. AGMB09787 TaxID=2922869 RepID=UPI001FAFBDBB|nr:hypothetical protein [Anaerococcus sp. AGMB09787]
MGYYWKLEDGLGGVELASDILKKEGHAGDGVETCIKYIEDFPHLHQLATGSYPIRI